MSRRNQTGEFSTLSRRNFLKRSLACSVSLALPQILPSGILAANGRPGANDRIGIGFIGIGRQASGLLKNLLTLPAGKFVAVADVNLTRAREAAQKHGAVALQDFRLLLERKDVDAVITATPEHWREYLCINACQAGKDLYVEKPMTLTIREGRLMVRAARKYNRVFQVGSQQRSMWKNFAACQLVRSGKLGKLTKVIYYDYPSPWEGRLPAQRVPAELDWKMWCGPNELVPYHEDLYLPRANPGWLSFRPYSGGEMTGWGAHGLDQVQWALNADETGPVEIWTEGDHFAPPTYTKPESRDRGDKSCRHPKVFFRYANGVTLEPGDASMGGATFVGENATLKIGRDVCDSNPEELGIEAMRHRPADFQDNHLENWLNCVRTRAKPVADVEVGHRSATVCHLGNIARLLGRRLQWDPGKEEFVGDPDANQYLTRQRRKPWVIEEKSI